jgi:hypothetical protein
MMGSLPKLSFEFGDDGITSEAKFFYGGISNIFFFLFFFFY